MTFALIATICIYKLIIVGLLIDNTRLRRKLKDR